MSTDARTPTRCPKPSRVRRIASRSFATTIRFGESDLADLREKIDDKTRDIEAARAGALRTSGSRPRTAREQMLENALSGAQTDLRGVERELTALLQRYRENHPDIVGKRKQIADLERRVRQSATELQAERDAADAKWQAEQRELASEPVKRLEADLEGLQRRMQQATETLAELREQEADLVDRIALMPGVEKELRRLEGLLAEAEKQYEERQKDYDEAQWNVEFYETSPAEDVTPYTVTEWATPPTQPTGPRRMAILLLAMVGGLGIGYGLVLLRQRFEETVVHSPSELQALLPGALVVGCAVARCRRRDRAALPGLRPRDPARLVRPPRRRSGRPSRPRAPRRHRSSRVALGNSRMPGRMAMMTAERKKPGDASGGALVPRSRGVLAIPQGEQLLHLEQPEALTAGGYLRLTAHILLKSQHQDFRTIAVVSPHEGEGRTTAAMNLALCLGRTRGRSGRVLLVDGDARNRQLSRLVAGDEGDPKDDPEAAARHPLLLDSGFDNVDLMTAPVVGHGLTIHDPSAWVQTLAEMATRYSQIVIDCPPILDSAEGLVLRDCAEELVLVVRAGVTTRKQIDQALDNVRKRVLGVIVNGCRSA